MAIGPRAIALRSVPAHKKAPALRERRGRESQIVVAPCQRAGARSVPGYFPLTSANFACARSNLSLNSHIASMISRKVADVLARSAWPNANTLLLRRYFMMVGSETL